MRVLMGLPHSGVKSPIPKHTALLIAALRNLGVEIETFGWGRHEEHDSAARRMLTRLADAWHVRSRLQDDRFDVLFVKSAHDLTGVMRDLPLSILTRGHVRSRVLQFHGSWSDKLVQPGHHALKFLTRRLIRDWSLILVLSQEERRQWQQFAPGAEVRVARNPYVRTMPRRDADAAGTADTLPDANRAKVVLFVGRLLAQKGVFDLVEAFRIAHSQVDCSLVLVGDGPERLSLSRTIERLNLSAVVSMRGHLTGDELRNAYRDADVFVLPSYREGFPTVITEAMDAGLPIITTHIRGAADLLAQESNALFVPPRRPDLLAENLVRLLQDEELRKRMGAANAEKLAVFEPVLVASEFLEFLEAL